MKYSVSPLIAPISKIINGNTHKKALLIIFALQIMSFTVTPPYPSSFLLYTGSRTARDPEYSSGKDFLACHKSATGCAFFKRIHTLRRRVSFWPCLSLSDFTLKPANLLSIIEHFLAFSTLSCTPPPAFTLKPGKTCCPIPIAVLCIYTGLEPPSPALQSRNVSGIIAL